MFEKAVPASQLKKPAVSRLVQDARESASDTQASNATPVLVQRARLNPHSLSHNDVLQLQRTIGNRVVTQLINREVTDLVQKFEGSSTNSSGTSSKAPVVTGGKNSISQLAQKFSGSPTTSNTTPKTPLETGKRSVTQLAQKFGGSTGSTATTQPKVGKVKVPDGLQEKLSSVFEGSKLKSSHKRGQNLAEEVVHGTDKLFDKDGELDESVANTPVTSEQIMHLVTLNNFNKIARKDPRSMSDEEKFTVIKANQMLSQEIKKGLKINKIIPDWQVNKRLNNSMGFKNPAGQFINTSNTFGGSVATEKNYKGITGSESVANFGLDYGSYQDQTTKQPVTASGNISPYLPEKSAFTGKYKTVQRTYFIKVDLPDDKIQDIKVPVAQELLDFANQLVVAATQVISDQGADKETKEKAQEKIAICQQFLAVAAAGLVNFTRNVDGSKNTEDPLNETGMTTKGSRVMEIIGPEGLTSDDYRTINQEYYLKGFLSFPQGTTMWVKTEKGEDTMVAQLVDTQTPTWNILRQDLLPTT